jgi:hypothetical protein
MLFGSCCIRIVVPFEPRISCPNASPMTLCNRDPIGRLSSVLGSSARRPGCRPA